MSNISCGDKVRVLRADPTEQQGLAGLDGIVHGWTTPSVTGVSVIGASSEDLAINVFIEERNEGFWFSPGLLEFVDHAPGTEVALNGVPKKWVRLVSGEWMEIDNAGKEKSQ
jgi:hypothetical protein